jgi:flagellar hook-length control protein FliK
MTMNFNSGGAIGAVNAIDALGGVQAVKRRESGSSSGGDHGGHGTTFSKAMRDARADNDGAETASPTTRGPDKARKEEDKRAVAKDDDATPATTTASTPPADAAVAAPDGAAANATAGTALSDPSVDKAVLLAADGQASADAANAALRAGCGLPALGLPAAGTTVPGAATGNGGIQSAMAAVRADKPQTAVATAGDPAAATAAGPAGQTLSRLSASGELPGQAGVAAFQRPAVAAGGNGNASVSDARARPGLSAGKGLPSGAPAGTQLTTDLPSAATVQMAQTLTQTHDWATMKVEGIRLQAEPGAGQSSTVDLAAAVQAGASMSLVQNQASSEAAAPATQAAIAVPLDSPEFAGALAKQVGYWINGGVQNAEIHLNPAEMGPISVQMTLQGGDARVDFSAVSAQTRQVLQDSIPQLAQMLEQAGMSLLSADVSAQQGRSQQREAPRQSSPSGGVRAGVQALDALGSASAVSAATLSRPRPSAPGRLDLYA